jgi:hypothetical protein
MRNDGIHTRPTGLDLTRGVRSVDVRSRNDDRAAQLRPLVRALGEREGCYVVEIDAVERVGEVLVVVTGPRGRLPFLFGPEELQPGYVVSVVTATLDQFGL